MVITTSPLCPCLHSPVTTGSLARSLFLHFSSLKLTPCHTLLPPLSVLHNAMCVIILLYFPSATLSHVIVDLAGPALPVSSEISLVCVSARLWSCPVSLTIVSVREVKERASRSPPRSHCVGLPADLPLRLWATLKFSTALWIQASPQKSQETRR